MKQHTKIKKSRSYRGGRARKARGEAQMSPRRCPGELKRPEPRVRKTKKSRSRAGHVLLNPPPRTGSNPRIAKRGTRVSRATLAMKNAFSLGLGFLKCFVFQHRGAATGVRSNVGYEKCTHLESRFPQMLCFAAPRRGHRCVELRWL